MFTEFQQLCTRKWKVLFSRLSSWYRGDFLFLVQLGWIHCMSFHESSDLIVFPTKNGLLVSWYSLMSSFPWLLPFAPHWEFCIMQIPCRFPSVLGIDWCSRACDSEIMLINEFVCTCLCGDYLPFAVITCHMHVVCTICLGLLVSIIQIPRAGHALSLSTGSEAGQVFRLEVLHGVWFAQVYFLSTIPLASERHWLTLLILLRHKQIDLKQGAIEPSWHEEFCFPMTLCRDFHTHP